MMAQNLVPYAFVWEKKSIPRLTDVKLMFQDFHPNPMGIFIQNVPKGRKPQGENLMFEFDGLTVLLIYFDRYAFQICEKNRNLA